MPDQKEINEFADSLTKLGHDVYDMTDNFKVNMSRRYELFLKTGSAEE